MDIAFDLVPRSPPTLNDRHAVLLARVIAGENPHDVAPDIGMTLAAAQVVLYRARKRGERIPKFHRRHDLEARDAEITRRSLAGETLEAIAQDLGITRERVRQICAREGLAAEDRGMRLMAKRRRADRLARMDARYMAKYGLTLAQVRTLRSIGATAVFIRKRQNARRAGIPWGLSLRDWWLVWHESGKWAERGPGRCGMSLYNRALGFVPGNVFIGAPADYMPYRSVSAVSHAPAQAAS